MKIISIDIKRSDIDEQLSKITAYTGAKSTSTLSIADLDRVATADEDNDLLSRYWANAANVIADCVKQFICHFEVSPDCISISLEISDAFDDSLANALREGMASFVTAFMAKAWFCITFPEKSDEWEAESSRLLSEISRNIYHRRRPLRHSSYRNQIPETEES